MKTVVLPTHTPALFAEAVELAAALLRAGELVALPTETVYGLAANAFDPTAVARIYEIKGRPSHNPIIVHVASSELARQCVIDWPPLATNLARSFWPGPLTLVLPRSAQIPDIITAGGPTVGIRWPSHPFIQAVIRACGFPLAAPSANLANQISPTNADHVRKAFDGKIPLIVDGGQSQVGLESTVLDITSDQPRLLRPGMIHLESLQATLSTVGRASPRAALSEEPQILSPNPTLRSPGQLPKHYSPQAKLFLRTWQNESDLEAQIHSLGHKTAQTAVLAHTHIPLTIHFARVAVLPHDAEAYARALYAELHQCDESGADLIIVEQPPTDAPWRAITDRLTRAATIS